MKPILRSLLLIAATGLFLAPAARASVYFTSDQSGGLSVAPGGTLTFDLYLHVTGGEQVTGIDYHLTEASGSSTGVFSITGVSGRSTSTFSYVITDDSAVISNDKLNPSSVDLGAGTASGAPVSNGTYAIATYQLSVAQNTALGAYGLTFNLGSMQPNGDWTDASNNDNNMSTLLTVPVNVAAPEPPAWILVLMFLVLGLPLYQCLKNKTSAVTSLP